MSRKKLFVACTISVLLVSAVLLVFFLPRSYESTCGLAYRDSAEGSNRYAFDDGDKNPAVVKRLLEMRNSWLTRDFKLRVCRRILSQCQDAQDDELMRVVSAASMEIRPQKISVLVRVKAPSPELSSICAQAIAEEIIALTAEQGRLAKEKGIAQLRRNHDKHEQYAASLRKDLKRLKAKVGGADGMMVKSIEDRIAMEEKTIAALDVDLAAIQKVDCWCGIFVMQKD